MIGAIIGDLAGSEYEWSEYKFKGMLLPFLFQRPSFTDDTVMKLAVADALMTYEEMMGLYSCSPSIFPMLGASHSVALRSTLAE